MRRYRCRKKSSETYNADMKSRDHEPHCAPDWEDGRWKRNRSLPQDGQYCHGSRDSLWKAAAWDICNHPAAPNSLDNFSEIFCQRELILLSRSPVVKSLSITLFRIGNSFAHVCHAAIEVLDMSLLRLRPRDECCSSKVVYELATISKLTIVILA